MQIHGGEGKTKDIRLDFSVNVNPLGMPRSVRNALAGLLLDPAAMEVYPDRTCEGLRRAAAGHYGVPEDWIVCGCGASELIYKIAGLYRGCRALVISPGFGEYEKALREAGCGLTVLKLKRERDFSFDEDFYERFCRAVGAGENRPDLVFLCSPNNPVGGRIPHEMLKNMLRLCMCRGVRAVVDECFLPFVTEKERTLEFLKEYAQESFHTGAGLKNGRTEESLPDEWNGNVAQVKNEVPCPVILKALTKSHAIPGVRLGLAISPDTEFVRSIRETGAPWTVSGVAAVLGEAAFLAWDEGEFRHMRNAVAEERKFLVSGLTEAGAKVYSGEGNFILFSVSAGESLFEFMRGRGILIRSCESFGLGTDFYRIAVRTREENESFLSAFCTWAIRGRN
ncbi:MAG: aminotransferase class I/II-fold pyridoxal phosphate-dependent enzyme [Lachnospiraceae bacterium]|nr:aminotransferase class I/II-fold pyridoxal phosphate-dependent enzyme [Lachnospiraceae bacterium]